jgi:hypothetical protein
MRSGLLMFILLVGELGFAVHVIGAYVTGMTAVKAYEALAGNQMWLARVAKPNLWAIVGLIGWQVWWFCLIFIMRFTGYEGSAVSVLRAMHFDYLLGQ